MGDKGDTRWEHVPCTIIGREPSQRAPVFLAPSTTGRGLMVSAANLKDAAEELRRSHVPMEEGETMLRYLGTFINLSRGDKRHVRHGRKTMASASVAIMGQQERDSVCIEFGRWAEVSVAGRGQDGDPDYVPPMGVCRLDKEVPMWNERVRCKHFTGELYYGIAVEVTAGGALAEGGMITMVFSDCIFATTTFQEKSGTRWHVAMGDYNFQRYVLEDRFLNEGDALPPNVARSAVPFTDPAMTGYNSCRIGLELQCLQEEYDRRYTLAVV